MCNQCSRHLGTSFTSFRAWDLYIYWGRLHVYNAAILKPYSKTAACNNILIDCCYKVIFVESFTLRSGRIMQGTDNGEQMKNVRLSFSQGLTKEVLSACILHIYIVYVCSWFIYVPRIVEIINIISTSSNFALWSHRCQRWWHDRRQKTTATITLISKTMAIHMTMTMAMILWLLYHFSLSWVNIMGLATLTYGLFGGMRWQLRVLWRPLYSLTSCLNTMMVAKYGCWNSSYTLVMVRTIGMDLWNGFESNVMNETYILRKNKMILQLDHRKFTKMISEIQHCNCTRYSNSRKIIWNGMQLIKGFYERDPWYWITNTTIMIENIICQFWTTRYNANI